MQTFFAPAIVPAYAGILTAIFVFLSLRVIGLRRNRGVAIGTQGDRGLERAMRVHANFAEYVPLALLLLLMAELQGGNALALHALAGTLVLARAIHAFGVSKEAENFRFRVAGMILTFGVMLLTASWLLARALGF